MKKKKAGRNRVAAPPKPPKGAVGRAATKPKKTKIGKPKAVKKAKAKAPPSSPRPPQEVVGKAKEATKKAKSSVRPKSFAQSPASKKSGSVRELPGLPENYGRDKLVLMSKDPDQLFVHWEITPALLSAREGEKRKGEEYREVFRLNWPARSLFDVNFAMLPASFVSRRWYLRIPYPGLTYRVDLGWLGNGGHFISVLGSNEAEAPESWETARKRGAPADWNPSSGSFSSGSRGA